MDFCYHEAMPLSIQRLYQALSIEAKQGYPDVVGSTARFSEFILGQLKDLTHPDAQPLRRDFARYGELDMDARTLAVQKLLGILSTLGDGSWRDESVEKIKGVGPKLSGLLNKLGIFTVEQLLRHYPRQHLDYAKHTQIKDLSPDEKVTVCATIKKVEAFQSPKKPISIVSVTVGDGTGWLVARWFFGKSNRYQLDQYKARYPVGEQVLLSGSAKWDEFLHRTVMDRPEFELVGKAQDSLHVGRIVPVYPLTEGIFLKVLRKAIYEAVTQYCDRIQDPIPLALRTKLDLGTQAEAIRQIHYPSEQAKLDRARRHLIFWELFLLQLGFCYRREQYRREEKALALPSTGTLINAMLEQLPFELTGAQKRVLGEILGDMQSTTPMNRLVQGDVGSGKTVVALLALLAAVEAGYQGALMAPTEILAEQHFQKFQEWLGALGMEPALLLGKQTSKERAESLRRLASGEAPIAVGTHALIQEAVEFQKLGMVIIDEQHRFGVKQRAALRAKGDYPQVLSMTATPIPRTLALSQHGDLDVSLIDELPPGRKPVETQWLTGKAKDAWKVATTEIKKGRQIYVVLPLIEESETLDIKAATVEYERLCAEYPEYRIGLLHGKMDDKDGIIGAFRRHEMDILVSTTVIEVGVDVPNATVMIIENAERFGLAQLHQLRGRVGRGGEQSYCVLVTKSKVSETTRRRMEVMVATNDGFVIAEEDLRLRGPGEFLGLRQSGMPDLVLADIVRDAPLLEEAHQAASEIISADPELKQNPLLKAELLRHFRDNLGFLGIG